MILRMWSRLRKKRVRRVAERKLLADMGRFNEELVKAGVMLAGEACTRVRGRVRYRQPASGDRRPVC